MSTDTNDTNPATADSVEATSQGEAPADPQVTTPNTVDPSPGNEPAGNLTASGDGTSPGNEAPGNQAADDTSPGNQVAQEDGPARGNEAPGNQAAAAASSPGNEATGNQVAEDDGPAPGNEIRRNVAPSIAETAWDEESEPGDDIGNRIDGPAHHERTTVDAETAAAKKTRNKRRKKRPDGKEGEPAGRRGKGKGGNAQSRERPAFHIGEEVFGKVVEILPDAIIIDLSSKAKAIFDRHELSGDLPQPGDQFIAQVHGDGSRGGMVVLTNTPLRVDASKEKLQAAEKSGEAVEALVTGVIKGGVELDADGLRAFAPGSHVDLKLGADLSYLVGQRLSFKVMKYAKNGKEVVLSRREQLEEQATQNRKEGLALLQTGSVVDAVVRSIVDWGVFVAIPSANNIEGLIHVSEVSHERNAKLGDLFKVGQKTEVKILRIDDKGKLWLSRKAVSGDPWEAAADKLGVGTRHTGRVARMQPFGVFVELLPGIDGLIRTSDLSLRRINDPSEITSVGEELDVIVVHLDMKQRKVGLHPALAADVEEPRQKVAPHRTVKVEVVSPEPAGLIVRVLGVTGGAARGFIPAGHTGTARGTDLRKEFPVGAQFDAKIIEMDVRRGEAKLSIRALKEDSEKAAYNEYRTKVARESKFGTFGDLFAKRRNGD